MPKYKVTKPFTHEGRTTNVGDPIELHERQAQYLLMQGKVKPAPPEKKDPKAKKK